MPAFAKPDARRCPTCGAALAVDAPHGLCPKCLFAGVEAATETMGGQGRVRAAAPSVEKVAAAFPQLEIAGLIGQGGMGCVFKARQPQLNRFVALKILPESLGEDAKFAERFTREAQALAALNHPNIVTVHDFGRSGGFFYLLMEFVDGVNLREAMRAGRFTPEQALAVVPPVCEALQYAHDHGIVHRDIKPENLLMDREGRVKIADFGIAKMLGEMSEAMPAGASAEAGATMGAGTPQYMAPEQRARAGRVDGRADLYSLGVVFYEMLTGELPAKRLEPPSRKVQVDVRLDAVVLRALELKPELRWQTAVEFRTQVEAIKTVALPTEVRRILRAVAAIAMIVVVLSIASYAALRFFIPSDAQFVDGPRDPAKETDPPRETKTQLSPQSLQPMPDQPKARLSGRVPPGSEKFRAHCVEVAASNGKPGAKVEELISWGAAQGGGLQAGVVMAKRVERGERLPVWIVVRNISETETRDVEVVYSWNTLHLTALSAGRDPLETEDWFMRLFGTDAVVRAKIGPGEWVEFEAPPVLFTDAAAAKPLYVRVPADQDRCLVQFHLGKVFERVPGLRELDTGEVEIVVPMRALAQGGEATALERQYEEAMADWLDARLERELATAKPANAAESEMLARREKAFAERLEGLRKKIEQEFSRTKRQ
jgi:serine/threonine protein kinase